MMIDLIRRFEFRAISYEEDASSLVDMHRCFEQLEGGWFDDEVTARRHQKIVARCPGSSWVLSCERMIFGYADLVQKAGGIGSVPRWRIHPDFRQPPVARKLFDGLRQEALKRGWSSLELFADTAEVREDLAGIGLQPDRCYYWANPADVVSETRVEHRSEIHFDPDALVREGWQSFLGSPLALRFVLTRAFMASSYAAFRYTAPKFWRLSVEGNEYLACYDGREWHVFRHGRSDADAEAVQPILAILDALQPARIMLSEKAGEIAGAFPASDQRFWDFFIDRTG
ncbi:MAG TPA: hypothetical protein PLP29_14060 [Candidatus Ozemobacteraceae bacterium]|nr:hypothetical protein [Candidatus Ozemobacteraceae bacterium]